jgi:hypothetical protein
VLAQDVANKLRPEGRQCTYILLIQWSFYADTGDFLKVIIPAHIILQGEMVEVQDAELAQPAKEAEGE